MAATLLLVVVGLAVGSVWIAGSGVVDSGREGRVEGQAQDAASAPLGAPADVGTAASAIPASAQTDRPPGITVYYFHRTIRCPTCLAIEAHARAAVEEYFADDLAAGRLAWQTVNIESPGNEHYERDFDLQSQSLVLAETVPGASVRWKNLPDVWNLVDDERAFAEYVRQEVSEFGGP